MQGLCMFGCVYVMYGWFMGEGDGLWRSIDGDDNDDDVVDDGLKLKKSIWNLDDGFGGEEGELRIRMMLIMITKWEITFEYVPLLSLFIIWEFFISLTTPL